MKTPQPPCLVDTERHEVTVNGKITHFPTKEFNLLVALAKSKGKILSRNNLITQLWGYNPDELKINSRTVDQHIARIRVKARRHGQGNIIQTVANSGYRSDSISLVKDESKDRFGKVNSIRRVYGKKPGSWVTLFVPDLLPDVEKGRSLRLS